MKRRDFTKKSLIASGGALIAGHSFGQINRRKNQKITILHTNDTHSNIEPFPANHPKYPNMGGVSRRFELIQNIREQEEHVLLLDSGDFFQGTPYFNKYGGVLEMKLMTEMGYDAATLGNHDFDGGMDGFIRAKKYADFPFLCANYDFTDTIMHQQTQRNVIFKKGGIKIGVFGIGIELAGLVPESKYGLTKYLDPIQTANNEANHLKNEGCDLIICLSHLGLEYDSEKVSDRLLAKNSKHIHLILGGHTHTFIERPIVEKNRDGQTVLINQVGWAGLQIGRIDFHIDSKQFSKKDYIIVL